MIGFPFRRDMASTETLPTIVSLPDKMSQENSCGTEPKWARRGKNFAANIDIGRARS